MAKISIRDIQNNPQTMQWALSTMYSPFLAYLVKSRLASTACGLAAMHKLLIVTFLGEEKLKDFGERLADY